MHSNLRTQAQAEACDLICMEFCGEFFVEQRMDPWKAPCWLSHQHVACQLVLQLRDLAVCERRPPLCRCQLLLLGPTGF